MKKLRTLLSDLDASILPSLGKTTKALHLVANDAFEQHTLPITRPQLILLRKLVDQDGVPQNNLAFITDRDKASLARLVQKMEAKGLVTRKPSQSDGRVNLVYITPKGLATLESSMPVLIEIIEKAQKDISQAELATFLTVLEKIRENIKADKLIGPLINN